MGNCIYCGQPVGFLSNKHPECEQLCERGKEQIALVALRTLSGNDNLEEVDKALGYAAQSCRVPITDQKALLINSWEKAVNQALNDNLLSKEEDDRLIAFQNRYQLTQDDLNQNGAYLQVAKASILRDILSGTLPQRKVNIIGPYTPNLLKGEQAIWAFPNSNYSEDKTQREIVGKSRGVSIRIMKGVYYRVGEFKGHTVEQTDLVHIDTGWVFIASKSLYFVGPKLSTRIPYAKVISFQPFSDGIGIIRDTGKAKRTIIKTGDGWFTYNLVINLSQI